MALIQADPARPNMDVSIDAANPAVLRIGARQLPNGAQVAATQFDLSGYQGGPFRLYIENDGSLQVALAGEHYWLLVEAILPERSYRSQETGQVDELGQPIIEQVELPLNLEACEIVVYPWPEGVA